MAEPSKYHDALSDSLNIENALVVPDKDVVDATPVPINKSEAMLFDNTPEKQNTPVEKVEIIPEDESIRDVRRDYRETRARLHQLSEMGAEALQGVLEVAQESEHPRAYEVVAQLVKNLADNSEKLMRLHHDMQDLEDKKNKNKEVAKPAEEVQKEKAVTNNSIFVGSTAELQKMIEGMNNGR